MADNHFRINRGLSLVPQASAPANPVEGDIYFDGTLGFQKYQFGEWTGISGTGRLPTTVVTTDTILEPNNVYFADSASKIKFTLPATNEVGDEIIMLSAGTGSFKLCSDITVAQDLGFDNTLIQSVISTQLTFINGQYDYAVMKIRANDVNKWVTEYHTGVAEFVGNYFGDASDGNTTISSNTNLSSSSDGDMVVKNYGNLTINSGVTLTTSNRCKGLLLYVKGDLVVNGTISMSSRGANVDPVSAGVAAGGLMVRKFDDVGTDSDSNTGLLAGAGATAVSAENNQPAIAGDGTLWVIPRAGASGGAPVSLQSVGSSVAVGNPGTAGTGGQSGGGASGGCGSGNNFLVTSGAGAAGTCFSGGSAGAAGNTASAAATAGSGAANGGAGGNALTFGDASGGGAGNPGGNPNTGAGAAGGNGTGGLLIIIVKGNVTIGGSGSVQAFGAAGGNANSNTGTASGGGGSGGGSILFLYAGTLSNSGSVSAAGGAGGNGTLSPSGGAGGAGSVQMQQIGA